MTLYPTVQRPFAAEVQQASEQDLDPNVAMVVGGTLVVASLALYGLVGYGGYKIAAGNKKGSDRVIWGAGGAAAGVAGLILLTQLV